MVRQLIEYGAIAQLNYNIFDYLKTSVQNAIDNLAKYSKNRQHNMTIKIK